MKILCYLTPAVRIVFSEQKKAFDNFALSPKSEKDKKHLRQPVGNGLAINSRASVGFSLYYSVKCSQKQF